MSPSPGRVAGRTRLRLTTPQIDTTGAGMTDSHPGGEQPMTSETIDLPDDVMAEAAQDFFAAEWASAMEGGGFSFAAGTEITEVCPPQDTAELLELVRPYVVRLARAWGMGVEEMFR